MPRLPLKALQCASLWGWQPLVSCLCMPTVSSATTPPPIYPHAPRLLAGSSAPLPLSFCHSPPHPTPMQFVERALRAILQHPPPSSSSSLGFLQETYLASLRWHTGCQCVCAPPTLGWGLGSVVEGCYRFSPGFPLGSVFPLCFPFEVILVDPNPFPCLQGPSPIPLPTFVQTSSSSSCPINLVSP